MTEHYNHLTLEQRRAAYGAVTGLLGLFESSKNNKRKSIK